MVVRKNEERGDDLVRLLSVPRFRTTPHLGALLVRYFLVVERPDPYGTRHLQPYLGELLVRVGRPGVRRVRLRRVELEAKNQNHHHPTTMMAVRRHSQLLVTKKTNETAPRGALGGASRARGRVQRPVEETQPNGPLSLVVFGGPLPRCCSETKGRDCAALGGANGRSAVRMGERERE